MQLKIIINNFDLFRMWVVGGMGEESDLSSVEVFNPTTGEWKLLSQEMKQVNGWCSVALGKHVNGWCSVALCKHVNGWCSVALGKHVNGSWCSVALSRQVNG